MDDVARLELIVAKMRELGVVKYDGIELGPEPTAEQDEDKVNEQRVTLEKRETERRERLRFAASGGPRLGDRRVR